MTPCSPMMMRLRPHGGSLSRCQVVAARAAVRARHLLKQKLKERLLRNGWANSVASFV